MYKEAHRNLSNRSSIRLILVFLTLYGLWSCRKDSEEVGSVKIETYGVSDITAKGATFEALISTTGNPGISEHGFLWAEHSPDWESRAQKISFEGKPSQSLVSIFIERDLIIGKTYVLAAYVMLDGNQVMGNFVLFVSMGSKGPQITDFIPKDIFWEDTITIRGRYFGNDPAKIKVMIDQVSTPIVYLSDSLIRVTVPQVALKRISGLRVSVQGNLSVAKDSLYMVFPDISGASPLTVRFGDTVTLHGTGFHPTGRFTRVFVNDTPAILLEANSSSLRFVIPYDIRGKHHDLTIRSSGNILQLKNRIEIAQPVIHSIHTDNGLIEGRRITLSGENFHPKKEFNVLKFDDLTAWILSASSHEIVAIIPGGIIKELHTTETRDINLLLDAGGNMAQAKAKLEWRSYFTRKKDFPGPLLEQGAFFAIHKNLYFGLGYERKYYGDPEYTTNFWKYQTESDEWKLIGPFPGNRRHDPVVYVLNNRGFVGLGISQGLPYIPYSDSIYSFDPHTETWSFESKFPGGPFTGAFSFVMGDEVWMGSGNNINPQTNWWDNTNSVWKYSSQTGHWEQQPDFPVTSWGLQGATSGNVAFVSTQNSGIFKFNGNSFSPFYPHNSITFHATVFFAINDKIYTGLNMIGHQIRNINHVIHEIDAQTGNITRVFNFPRLTDLYGIQVCVENGKAYFVGGPDRHTWEFDPSVELP